MSKLWWTVCAVALLAAVSGCAVNPKAIQAKTSGKSIAVVADTGARLNLMWIGTTIFNNEYGSRPIADWKIDQVVADRLAEAMRQTARYTHVLAIQNVNRKSRDFPRAMASDADFVLLIESGVAQDKVFQTNQFMSGIGVAQRSMFNTQTRTVGFTALSAELFDANSGMSLGKYEMFDTWPFPGALQSGPGISDRQLSQFRETLLVQIHDAIVPGILGNMGLQ